MRQRWAKPTGYLRAPLSVLKRISAITRYKLRKLLLYALVTAAVGTVFSFFISGVTLQTVMGWAVLGAWTGVLEEFLFGRRFRSLAIPLQLIGKAVGVNLFTITVLVLALLADRGHTLPSILDLRLPTANLVWTEGFYRTALQVLMVTSVAILIVQVEEFMGRQFFMGFLLGWYDKPRESEKVVLSIDLVSSSALNERLGDLLYFRFLNTTHSLMTDAVLRHDAEIHKYVGDEVIFTWPMREGLANLNCLALYFEIKDRLEAHRTEMMRQFGVAPQFRGGLHGGRVITARIGHIKRAIDLSGDVMNTTNRAESMAKDLKTDLVITQDLLDRMPGAEEHYTFGDPVPLRVKGGKRQVFVRTVARKQSGTGASKKA
jgi:adenylate cyclase